MYDTGLERLEAKIKWTQIVSVQVYPENVNTNSFWSNLFSRYNTHGF